MSDKSFTQSLDEIKEITKKLNDSNTSMEDSIELFKQGTSMIKHAKEQLETIEGTVKKVLEDNKLEDFE
ncbi:exodeoxyribonuclease VII small subunit [Spiroplasma chinense]|uniref:Exodeoxyribonuclease 7 small subunit n=1 Tax=Spiroplasma chinense TaxID=216932 RepID=A0A5B9Y3Z1_9MOLU|nr:exodeoxyribonuclease VII small subunit [Spiroplasma chinense]QEH61878.1 exodeoxyribonuclease VII small subunit [Spiroplasma chinense]